MIEEKKWYVSKSVLGGVVAVIASVFGIFGTSFDVGTQAQVVDIVIAVSGAVGGALAIYGRIKATKKVV